MRRPANPRRDLVADFDRKAWAFNLTLFAGILFIFRGIRNVIESQDVAQASAFMGGMGGMFDGVADRLLMMGLFGLAGGAFLVFAALRMRARPQDIRMWGIAAVIAAGATYMLAESLVAAIAGLAGGGVAIAAEERAPVDGPTEAEAPR